MKKSGLLFLMLLFTFTVYSQDEVKAPKVKTGWNFGALPAITFDTDLGFQYGAVVNLYDYGDGKTYPNYKHNIYLEASRYTKGSAIYLFSYDSEYLIPGVRVTSDIAYLPDDAFGFFGFNGYEAKYNVAWEDTLYDSYKTRMYYRYKNYYFRFKTDFQFSILGERILGLVGFNAQYYNISAVDIAKLNKGKEDVNDLSKLPEDENTLYDDYINMGIIPESEADGGFIPLLKAGLVYDSRDNEPNPMRGIWAEAFVFGAPSFLGAESGFAKLNVTFRQYFTLVKRDLSFAYRLAYQGRIAGHVPFYYQTQIETSLMKDQLGLGGGKTLRGVERNRVVADGVAYANAELRWKVVHFNWINQNFYIGLNGFVDAGMAIQKIDVQSKVAGLDQATKNEYFDFENSEGLHVSYGAGLRIAMNENFVVKADAGFAPNPQDGGFGLYIGLDYLF